MNLTGQKPHQKGTGNTRARKPTAEEKAYMNRVARLPCVVGPAECNYWGFPTTIHHCGTGGGGTKNHLLVIPLCWEHHLGALGIDGKRMSKRAWQEKYGTETALLAVVARALEAMPNG